MLRESNGAGISRLELTMEQYDSRQRKSIGLRPALHGAIQRAGRLSEDLAAASLETFSQNEAERFIRLSHGASNFRRSLSEIRTLTDRQRMVLP